MTRKRFDYNTEDGQYGFGKYYTKHYFNPNPAMRERIDRMRTVALIYRLYEDGNSTMPRGDAENIKLTTAFVRGREGLPLHRSD